MALSDLLGQDGAITHHCPNGPSQPEYHVYGREVIAMFYRNKFTFGKHGISEAEVLSKTQAKYVANYGGYLVMAIAAIRRTTPDGLIKRLSVRPK